jgi:hypothetical protein
VILGGLARSRATGQLVLQADDGKRFAIAFMDGWIVGASSPLAADSVARIALTSQLVSSSQVQDIARKVAAFPDRDEVAMVSEVARLSPEQIERLRKRMVGQRASRSFVPERGTYEFQADIALPTYPGVAIDVAAVIFLGAAMNLSELRLAADVREFGGRFVMKGERLEDLGRFGFTDQMRPLLEDLYAGTSLPELDAKYRDLEPRTMQAIIYALVSTDLCEGLPAPGIREIRLDDQLPAPVRGERSSQPSLPPPTRARGSTPSIPPRQAAGSVPPQTLPSIEDGPARTRTATFESPTALKQSPLASGSTPSIPRTVTPRKNVVAVRAAIAAGLALVDQGADHFALLGLPFDASVDAVRSAYVRHASLLHPDKLPPLGPAELRDAQRLFHHVGTAYQVLTDPVRRSDYIAGLGHAAKLAQGSQSARTSTASAAEIEQAKVKMAAEAVERGLAALRRDDLMKALMEFQRAVEYCPQDVDFQSQLAWAKFCAAEDKAAVALETRRVLERALFKTHNPIIPRSYLGRVERILGRNREALHHFKEVLALEPNNHDAQTEVRLLEQRAGHQRRR